MQTFIDKYIDQGIQQGMQQGMQQGAMQILMEQMQARFGNIPTWAKQKIELADMGMIEKWSIRLLDSESLKDVIGGEAVEH